MGPRRLACRLARHSARPRSTRLTRSPARNRRAQGTPPPRRTSQQISWPAPYHIAPTRQSQYLWPALRHCRRSILVVRVWIDLRADAVAEHPDAFDLHLHQIAWLQVASRVALADGLADGPAADGAAAEHIARHDAAVAGGALHKGAPGVVHPAAM